MKNTHITVGDIIYIDTALHLSHGIDDIIGGKALVVRVDTHGVSVAIDPETTYNWVVLSKEQDRLRIEFGDQWAHRRPDYRPEFNS